MLLLTEESFAMLLAIARGADSCFAWFNARWGALERFLDRESDEDWLDRQW